MRTNHSPLRFLGLIATASVLASGVYANGAQAATIASTTKANGASASPALVGSSSASETGTRNLVDGTRTAVDSNRNSRAIPEVITTTNGGVLSPKSGPRASGSATPGQQFAQVAPPAAPAKRESPTPPGQSPRVDTEVTPLGGGGNSAGASTSATVPSATTTTIAATDPSPADSVAGTPPATQLSPRPAPASRPCCPDAAHRVSVPDERAELDTARRDTANRDKPRPSRQNLSRRSLSSLSQLRCPPAIGRGTNSRPW